jgi:hypothetical protein
MDTRTLSFEPPLNNMPMPPPGNEILEDESDHQSTLNKMQWLDHLLARASFLFSMALYWDENVRDGALISRMRHIICHIRGSFIPTKFPRREREERWRPKNRKLFGKNDKISVAFDSIVPVETVRRSPLIQYPEPVVHYSLSYR